MGNGWPITSVKMECHISSQSGMRAEQQDSCQSPNTLRPEHYLKSPKSAPGFAAHRALEAGDSERTPGRGERCDVRGEVAAVPDVPAATLSTCTSTERGSLTKMS